MTCYVIWHRGKRSPIIGSFAKQWPEVWCAAISLGGTCIFWYFLFQTLPDTFGIVAQQWSHIETLLKIALDHGENRGQSGRKWTFDFKTAFVDCVVWSVQDTRICSVAKGERSYHVFFQLLQACKHSSRETERNYTYTYTVCKSIQIMWTYIYIYICTHCHIHIIDLQRINHVIIHDMQRPGISNCWLNIVLKEARVSRFRFQIMSFGGSDSRFPPLLIEILHQSMGILLEIHYL